MFWDLCRSAEKERERRIAQAHSNNNNSHVLHNLNASHSMRAQPKEKESGRKRKKEKKKETQALLEELDASRVLRFADSRHEPPAVLLNAIFVFVFQLEQERLKWRIDELNQMLIEEKHNNRKDKLAVAKLQQEVARQKSERNIVSIVFMW